jgi:hypothetical protein
LGALDIEAVHSASILRFRFLAHGSRSRISMPRARHREVFPGPRCFLACPRSQSQVGSRYRRPARPLPPASRKAVAAQIPFFQSVPFPRRASKSSAYVRRRSGRGGRRRAPVLALCCPARPSRSRPLHVLFSAPSHFLYAHPMPLSILHSSLCSMCQ